MYYGGEFVFDKKACGCRLKQLRIERNMTQAEVAGEVGISADTISKLEQGRRAPSASNICILANYYQTTTDFIVLGVQRKGSVEEWIRRLPVEKRRKVERMLEDMKELVE